MFKKLLYIGLTTLVISLFLVISGINFLMTNTDLFESKNTEKIEKMVVIDTTKVEFVKYDTVKVKIQKTIPKPVTIVRDTIPTPTLDTIK
jgi:hypothetical protein